MRIANFIIAPIAVCCLLLVSVRADDANVAQKPTLFIVGDSTVKNSGREMVGWGEKIGSSFDADKIRVENRAIAGRSSRTFINEGRWDKILEDAKPGDFVLIQMGHNDGGPIDDGTRARGSLPGLGDETKEIDNSVTKKHEVVHTYGWYMKKYITDAKAKQMTAIICSPVPHCPTKQVEAGAVENSKHVGWSEEVAKQESVPFIHLNKLIMRRYAGLEPTEIKSNYFTSADNTHTSAEGAELNAQCVVEGIRSLKDCPLANFLRADSTAPKQ
jgi:rhamnogalacturonan acetylesterase